VQQARWLAQSTGWALCNRLGMFFYQEGKIVQSERWPLSCATGLVLGVLVGSLASYWGTDS
jgi:hypothetical protein